MKDNKGLYKKLFTIVAPIAFQYMMSSLVSASDAFMLGFLDQDSLSASSLAGQIAFVYSLFFGAFVAGCGVLAAQYWGKKDQRTVEEVLAITMRYSLIIGALFSLAAALLPRQIMHIFTPHQSRSSISAYCGSFLPAGRLLAGLFRHYEGL